MMMFSAISGTKRTGAVRPGRSRPAGRRSRSGSHFRNDRAASNGAAITRPRAEIRPKAVIPAIIVAALMALPAVYMNSAVGYVPILFVLFLYAVSMIYASVLIRGMTFEESSGMEQCIRGTDLEFQVRVRNATRLVCMHAEAVLYVNDAFGKPASEETLKFALARGEERVFTFSVRFEHIGTYTVGLRKLKVGGLLGVVPLVAENARKFEVSVAPKIHPLEDIDLSDRIQNESLRSYTISSAESIDYAGVREYAFGDPIKRIHWKLSSHAGGYMTKLLESYGNNGVSVVPDLLSPVYSRDTLLSAYDAIMEMAFSICRYVKDNGLDAEMVCLSREGRREVFAPYDVDDFIAVMHEIPTVYTSPSPSMDARRLISPGDGGLALSYTNIAFCTATADKETIQALLALRQIRRNPMLFFFLPESVYGDERSKAMKPLRELDAAEIPYVVITSADQIGKGAV
ncbi:MAG: DUF58 domain-containing protein [Anaerovoracaceae bacterium]|jgi:uncharacterized protein (DUF58 family)